jgi:hypothetical protein
MRTFRIAASAFALIAGISLGMPAAHADEFDFSTPLNGAVTTGGSANDCTTTCKNDIQNIDVFKDTSGGSNTISAAAFSTTATSFSTANGLTGGAAPALSTAFLGDYTTGSIANPTSVSQLGNQTLGLGVTNRNEGTGGSPAHTLGNGAGLNDVIAFVLPGSLTDPLKIILNQFCANGSSGPTGCSGTNQGKSDISILVGNLSGTASTILAGLKNGTTTLKGFTLLGANDVSSTPNNGLNGSGNREVDITNTNLNDNVLIVTASLADLTNGTLDFVKIGALVTQAPRAVPEPGTLAVFGIGLAGLIALRRRQRRIA